MIKEAVSHLNIEPYVYPISRNHLVIRIRTGAGDIHSCRLIHWDRMKPESKREQELICVQREELFDYYEADLKFTKVARYHKYCFYLEDRKGEHCYYGTNGFFKEMPREGYFEYLYANEKDVVKLPSWAEGAVYYQIFPERFCNGDLTNDPEACVAWGSRPTRENYMGGDLKGILSKLPYLKELGIECLYLTPVFEGDFNHKYATTDYFRIDPAFGTEVDFEELVKTAHSMGIKIMLDGVFNHTGIQFRAFKDILEKQESSIYKDWYYINQFPVSLTHHDYECVGAYKWMPKLNSSNPKVRAFILEVMEFWIKEYGIDGWRLDVADEVDGAVWQEARLLKERYPDMLLMGETWGYGGRLLQSGQMDGVMNYLFRDAVRDYFAKGSITASEFDSRINHMLALHKREVNKILYNLLDSHDTQRFLYDCGEKKDLLKLAAAFQFLFPGAPALYYGDEAGMTGENDPDCRKAMVWDETADQALIAFYKQMIGLRKKEQCIRKGSYRTVYRDDNADILGFVRCYQEEEVYVLFNKGSSEKEISCPVLSSGAYRQIFGMEPACKADNKTEMPAASEVIISIYLVSDDRAQHYNGDIMEYQAVVNLKLLPYSVKVIKKGGNGYEER